MHARGLGSLYAHANEMTMENAGRIHMDWTPRGWMKTEKELLLFEQQLYLRQPGYGTSYITGKYLLERTLADYAKQLEERGEALRMFKEALAYPEATLQSNDGPRVAPLAERKIRELGQ